MTTEPRQIEALQQAFTSMPAGVRGEDCPEPERLWAAVRLKLPAEQRREIVQHVAVCAACAEDWRVTWKLSQEQHAADDRDPNGVVIRGPWTRFRNAFPQVAAAAPQLAAAALVVLAVGVAGWFFHDAPESTFRGETATPAQPAEGITPDGATLSRDEFVLRWTATEKATYNLKVMTDDGEILEDESGLPKAEFRVPPEVFEEVPSGSALLWQVEVADPVTGNTKNSQSFTAYVD
jgi:hypothetical protein